MNIKDRERTDAEKLDVYRDLMLPGLMDFTGKDGRKLNADIVVSRGGDMLVEVYPAGRIGWSRIELDELEKASADGSIRALMNMKFKEAFDKVNG